VNTPSLTLPTVSPASAAAVATPTRVLLVDVLVKFLAVLSQ
jgi:hypothetical protein